MTRFTYSSNTYVVVHDGAGGYLSFHEFEPKNGTSQTLATNQPEVEEFTDREVAKTRVLELDPEYQFAEVLEE